MEGCGRAQKRHEDHDGSAEKAEGTHGVDFLVEELFIPSRREAATRPSRWPYRRRGEDPRVSWMFELLSKDGVFLIERATYRTKDELPGRISSSVQSGALYSQLRFSASNISREEKKRETSLVEGFATERAGASKGAPDVI